MGYLALYDTVEIQKYIYNSNKLKDNIGASNLVGACFDKILINVLKELYEECSLNYNWKKNCEWKFFDDKLKVEVIYIGGGNALIAIDSKETWKDINYEFGKQILIKSRGLNFVTDIVEITDDFNFDLQNLFKKINLKKQNYRRAEEIKGLCITKECSVTKNMAVKRDKDEFISYEVFLKRNAIEKNDDDNKILDDISGKKGESYIGIVHIDGNNMGDKVRKITSEAKSYSEAVQNLRKFSSMVQDIYDEAYDITLREFSEKISKNENYSDIFQKSPFRKVLIKGDDVTYICYGKLAISSVERFFINLKKLFKKNNFSNFSACAGIAFIKPHFPYSQGYKIAEECCANAKLKAKEINENNPGYYFDFHIVRGALIGNLNKIRDSYYNKSGMKLLWRPFTIDKIKKEEAHKFEDIKDLINQLKKVPRNKVKELRDSFIFGENCMRMTINKIQSRNINMKFQNEKELIFGDSTPLFDTIEFMELYDDLFMEGE